jgi:transposase
VGGTGTGPGHLAHLLRRARAQRSAAITHVSADGAGWIEAVVRDRCPQAVRCADPFHVVRWATQALDEVRRDAWNTARHTPGGSRIGYAAGGRRYTRATGHAQALKGARWALWKNPENLTDKQAATLAWIAAADPRVHRAYLGKERLRLLFQMPPHDAGPALSSWLKWAQRSRLPSFVALGKRIAAHHEAIMASIEHRLSNGPTESVNAKTRLITRMAYGFHGPDPLIALAMLKLGPTPPTLPGRTNPRMRQ